MFIDSAEKLKNVCESIAEVDLVAVDTEFIREKTYYPKPCLLQIATNEQQFAIDVITLSSPAELEPLRRLLLDRHVLKIFHAARQDLEVCDRLFNEKPEPIFDTQIAESFLSTQTQIGYGALVEKYEGISLPKASSFTDWEKRPLDPSQLIYALDDVKYLPQIYNRMREELVALGRYTWVLPEFQAEIDAASQDQDPSKAFLHLKRTRSLRPRELRSVQAIAGWREKQAQQLNIPRKRVLGDETVLAIARSKICTPAKIRRVRGTSHLTQTELLDIVDVVNVAQTSNAPLEGFGASAQKDPKGTQAVVDLLYSYVRLLSEEQNIAASVIAHKDDIANFVRKDSDSRLMSGWRFELAGQHMSEILSGKVGLFVEKGQVRLK